MLAAAAHLGANAAVLVVIGVALTLFATGAARQHAGLNRWADDADVGRGSAGHEAAGGLAHVGAVETQANSAGSARAKCGRSRTRPATPHSFHPHDVRFRVLEHAGEAPPPSLAGLKDAVYVPPGETVRLLTWFEDYADPDLPYMFHCHVLEHEDRGMMGQFVIVNEAGNPRRDGRTARPATTTPTIINEVRSGSAQADRGSRTSTPRHCVNACR